MGEWTSAKGRPPEDGVDAASRTAEKEKMMAEYIERQAVIPAERRRRGERQSSSRHRIDD